MPDLSGRLPLFYIARPDRPDLQASGGSLHLSHSRSHYERAPCKTRKFSRSVPRTQAFQRFRLKRYNHNMLARRRNGIRCLCLLTASLSFGDNKRQPSSTPHCKLQLTFPLDSLLQPSALVSLGHSRIPSIAETSLQ